MELRGIAAEASEGLDLPLIVRDLTCQSGNFGVIPNPRPSVFLLQTSELQSIPCILCNGQGLNDTFPDSCPMGACPAVWTPEDPDQRLGHSLPKPWLIPFSM